MEFALICRELKDPSKRIQIPGWEGTSRFKELNEQKAMRGMGTSEGLVALALLQFEAQAVADKTKAEELERKYGTDHPDVNNYASLARVNQQAAKELRQFLLQLRKDIDAAIR